MKSDMESGHAFPGRGVYRIARIVLALLVASLGPLTSASPIAAADPEISGSVQDSSGGGIAHAIVEVLGDRSHRAIRRVAADGLGHYSIDLPPGRYVIRASADLFEAQSKPLIVEPDARSTVDFVLPLAGVVERVTVTERTAAELRRVPGGVAYVEEDTIEESRAHTLKDALGFTPGVLVQPRFGADESQISIRGSGLRNNFHLRGLNVFINGIPYQDADGFGDFESIELMASTGIEVWKGANALRYGGNSMGGAININTHTGETASPLSLWLQGGDFALFKGQVASGGTHGDFRYYASLSGTDLDSYREHAEQNRKRVFSNFGWTLDPRTELHFDLMYADVSEKLPGALTKEQFLANPRQANPVNVEQDYGRFFDYYRLGGRLAREIRSGQRLSVTAHTQYRDMVHPIFQVLDNDALNFGIEVTYVIETRVGDRANELLIGFAPQWGDVDERRFQNVGGQSGALTAQFRTTARNYGFFFEDQFSLNEDLRLVFGGRADWATREFKDLFLTDGDRSDDRTYEAFVPKVGFVWDRTANVQLYGNVSRSYEPPLLLELTSFGAPGFLDLKAQDAWQFELGTRGRYGEHVGWDVAFFDAEIRDEILNANIQPFPGAPFTIPSYRNIADSRHLGLELGTEVSLDDVLTQGARLSWKTAYTWSSFRFVDEVQFSDNDLPGAPRHLLRTEVRYDLSSGVWVAPNLDWSPSSYFVDSANTVENDDYAVLNLKAGYDFSRFGLFFQASNLTDENYSGSVQVDSSLGQFFEPSNGRSLFLGVRWHL